MKRWQWYTVAVFAGLMGLEAFVYAGPVPSCGGNMLCRVRSLVIGGGGTISKYITNTGTAAGASISESSCQTEATITETGAATGDGCFLGLPTAPADGLSYSCLSGTNQCLVIVCNANAAPATAMSGTHRCTVIH